MLINLWAGLVLSCLGNINALPAYDTMESQGLVMHVQKVGNSNKSEGMAKWIQTIAKASSMVG